MTVKELMEILSQYDPNTPVVVRGYEAGYNDISEVREIYLQLNVNTTWYYGAHEEPGTCSEPLPNVPFTSVVYLHGYNHIATED